MNLDQLAADFAAEVRASMTAAQLALVVERNKAEINPGVCHSHDFCDANQCMLDAMAKQLPEYVFDASDPKVMAVLDAAWAVSKGRGFA